MSGSTRFRAIGNFRLILMMQTQAATNRTERELYVNADAVARLLVTPGERGESKSVELTARGAVAAAFAASPAFVTLDQNGDFSLNAEIVDRFCLSANGFQNSQLDRWLEIFKAKMAQAKLGQLKFDPTKFTLELAEFSVQLPSDKSPKFEIKMSQLQSDDLEGVTNVTYKALSILGIYLRSIAEALHSEVLSGELKLASTNFDFGRMLGQFGSEVGEDLKRVSDKFSNTRFGAGLRQAFDKIGKRINGDLLDVEGLRYHPLEAIRFESIFGQDSQVERLREIAQILNSDHSAQEKRAAMARIGLLTGPPGVGKSHSIEALLQATETPAYVLSAATLMSHFYGDTERMTDQLMQELALRAQTSPTGIVFLVIDEGDTVLPARGVNTHEVTARTLALILQRISGIAAPEGVSILIATNQPESLDRALISRVDLELQYGQLTSKNVVDALKFRLGEFVNDDKGFKLVQFETTSLAAMLKSEDGRVIPRIIRELRQLRMLGNEERDHDGDIVINLALLKRAIKRATLGVSK